MVGLTRNGTIAVAKIHDHLTWVAAAVVTKVAGSTSPEEIGGGLILMVERAIIGT